MRDCPELESCKPFSWGLARGPGGILRAHVVECVPCQDVLDRLTDSETLSDWRPMGREIRSELARARAGTGVVAAGSEGRVREIDARPTRLGAGGGARGLAGDPGAARARGRPRHAGRVSRRGRAGTRRHGDRVPGVRPGLATAGGLEGAAPRPGASAGPAPAGPRGARRGAVPPRSPGRRVCGGGPSRGAPLPGDGVPRRPDAGPPDRARDRHGAAAGREPGRSGRRRAGRGARRGPGASRHQAGQHHDRPGHRPGQADGLRPGARRGRRREPDPRGRPGRHADAHEPRAGAGPGARRP